MGISGVQVELGKGFLYEGCSSEMTKQNWGGDLSQENGVTWEERESQEGARLL